MRVRLGSLELGPREVALAAGAVLLLVLAGLLIAVISRPESADTEDERPAASGYEWANGDRLVLPDDYGAPAELDWLPYRPRREAWTDDQVAQYWLDPQAIGLEVLDERVEEHVRRLLEEVP